MSDGGSWHYLLTNPARRDLRRLDSQMRSRVVAALDRLAEDPYSGDIRQVHDGGDQWRLRVGDWRVRYRLEETTATIVVLRILPRGRAYR